METTSNMEDEPLHVLDLPQLYQKPSFEALSSALTLLTLPPQTFSTSTATAPHPTSTAKIHPEGITTYLTSIISSSLSWLPTDEQREQLWESASERLAERAGRAAMSDMTRAFRISTTNADETQSTIMIRLHEPAFTSDNLGLKTWSSSFVLASVLHEIKPHIPLSSAADDCPLLAMELGAGTGLAGLAFAALHPHVEVVLTDLPAIVPNLTNNILLNTELLSLSPCEGVFDTLAKRVRVRSAILDWRIPTDVSMTVDDSKIIGGSVIDASTQKQKMAPSPPPTIGTADIILAADPNYSPSHPPLLTQTISTWLKRPALSGSPNESPKTHSHTGGIVLLAYPYREVYTLQVVHLHNLLREEIGLVLRDEGQEIVREDWEESVGVRWEVWGFQV